MSTDPSTSVEPINAAAASDLYLAETRAYETARLSTPTPEAGGGSIFRRDQDMANRFAPLRKRCDQLEAALNAMLDDVRYMHAELDALEADCPFVRRQAG